MSLSCMREEVWDAGEARKEKIEETNEQIKMRLEFPKTAFVKFCRIS